MGAKTGSLRGEREIKRERKQDDCRLPQVIQRERDLTRKGEQGKEKNRDRARKEEESEIRSKRDAEKERRGEREMERN